VPLVNSFSLSSIKNEIIVSVYAGFE